jgi:hypothetical protein
LVPAVANVAAKVERSDESRLRESAEPIVDAVKRDDIPEFLDADRTFHLALLRLNGNDELVAIDERLRDRSRLYGLKTLAESNELMSSAEEHLGILDAIFARDAAQAKSLMLDNGRLRRRTVARDMSYAVDFVNVSTVGLETSPVAAALAGLRANEARYFKNKYDRVFTVDPAAKAKKAIDWVHRILKEERDLVIASPALEATTFQVENIRWTYVFYENGLSINVVYSRDEPKKRAVGFKLSEGMEVPAELGSFKFARQKSKLAGTIRGSYFVIKGEY